ncbi:MAG: hypothetical protein DI536_28925 [Archangium gephyra]|uniref:Uncharacterized protein n=1 Tax=Archangium gephyra TaxID=48 RepID=A0A2W5SWA5_9BACT|nr:MAG: hypothetical protein DI536_28925 [Archangium gephyra]
MRTISATAAAARAAGVQADFVRVLVKDAGGTWRDLTTYAGANAVKTVAWAESVSEPHRTADVTLVREFFKLSFSPWISASAINKGFVHTASSDALLQLNREFRIEAAVVPVGREPGAGDWLEVFRGRIDTIDPAGDALKFGGRDLAGRLADQQIKKELVYSLAVHSGTTPALRPWEAGMTVVVGEYVLPASRGDDDPGQGKFYRCTTAGTTANAEPTWPTSGTVADGTAVWTYIGATQALGRPVEQVIQTILDTSRAAGDAAVTLYTPASPGWAVKEFLQGRDKTLNAVRALAQQIGWDVRMRWDPGTSAFRLTLYEPERTKTLADAAFTAPQYKMASKFETTLENIRNAWTIKFSDASDLWPDGSPKRKEVTVTNPTSIAKYGELWAEIAEGSASNIDSVTEATKMVNAALSDCSEPTADFSVELTGGFPWTETGDLYSFDADGRVFDSTQKMAVTKFAQNFEAGTAKLRTTLDLRGKPSLGALVWIAVLIDNPIYTAIGGASGNGNQRVPPMSHYPGTKTVRPVPVSVPGGIEIRLEDSTVDRARQLMEYEVHVSDSGSLTFPPTSSTLQAVTKGDRVTVAGRGGGLPLVARVVPRSVRNGRVVRGQPSKGVSANTGRVTADLLDSLAVLGGPLNSGFEDYPTTARPPSHWSSSEWGSADITVDSDTTVGRYVKFIGKAGMTSDVFGIGDAPLAALVGWLRCTEPGDNLELRVLWYSDAGTTLLSTTTLVVTPTFATINTWSRYSTVLTPPAGANFARVAAVRDTIVSSAWWGIGSLELQAFSRATLTVLQTGFPSPMRIAGANQWDLVNTDGDWSLGNSSHRIVIGNALGGGGAGAAGIAVKSSTGLNQLTLGAGLTSTQQQAITIVSGITAIAQSPWVAPTFQNSFSNYSGTHQPCGYYKDSCGTVHLRGLIQRPAGALTLAAIFTLPSGFRSQKETLFTVFASGGYCYIRVNANGTVDCSGGVAGWNTYFSLDVIKFDTR